MEFYEILCRLKTPNYVSRPSQDYIAFQEPLQDQG